MIDTAQILNVERLRDSVEGLQGEIRNRYRSLKSPVSANKIKKQAAEIGERWLVEVAGQPNIVSVVGIDVIAALSVNFQRLITYSERNTHRKNYDQTLKLILKDFRSTVTIPLKTSMAMSNNDIPISSVPIVPSRVASIVFIGQSFSPLDKTVNETIHKFFTALGLTVITGEKPRAANISKKVTDRIDQSDIFVGIFTCRDKLEDKNEWSTSSWVIDEKAYAFAKKRKLILIVEEGVVSIGGIQGDYEYLSFMRDNLADLLVRLVEIYKSLIVQ